MIFKRVFYGPEKLFQRLNVSKDTKQRMLNHTEN